MLQYFVVDLYLLPIEHYSTQFNQINKLNITAAFSNNIFVNTTVDYKY